jgi:hypothetical protein
VTLECSNFENGPYRPFWQKGGGCAVCRVSNPGLLFYDRDYASAPCALLPLPSPTTRTSNVIAVYVTSLDAPGLSTTSEFCLGWFSKLWFCVSVGKAREDLTSQWGKIWSPKFGLLFCVIYVCTNREVSLVQYNISECCNV